MEQPNPSGLRSTLVGLAYVISTLFCWAVTPVFVEYFTDKVDPWTSNGWRYGFSALLWAPVLIVASVRHTLPKDLFRKALVPGAINAAAQVVFVLAFYNTSATMVAVGLRSQIIVVSLGAALFFAAERKVIRKPAYIFAVALILGGLVSSLLLGGDTAMDELDGFSFALAAGAGYAMYALSVRHWMHGVNPLLAFAAISQYTAAAMLVLMLFFADDYGVHALDMDTRTFGLFLLSSVIGIAIGHVVYYAAIARLGVAVASGVVQTQPIWVGLISWGFLGQVGLTTEQWIGGGVAIVGAVIMLSVQHSVRRQLERESRQELRAGPFCSECGHSLAGMTEGVCPECGQPLAVQVADIPAISNHEESSTK